MSVAYIIDLEYMGFEQLSQRARMYEKSKKDLKANTALTATKIGEDYQRALRLLAPVNDRSRKDPQHYNQAPGTLKRTIQVRMTDGREADISYHLIGHGPHYMKYVLEGTSAHIISPRSKNALSFWWAKGNKWWYSYDILQTNNSDYYGPRGEPWVNHPGAKKNPFDLKAAMVAKDRSKKHVKQLAEKVFPR